jgi:Recombination endonuclease VII
MSESAKAWTARLWRGFKFTIKMWLALQSGQDNKCAICGQEEQPHKKTGRLRRLALDHDHSFGEVRGLLCRRCNTLLGKVERGGRSGKPWTLDELKAAVAYKEHPPARDILGYIHIGYTGSVSTKAHRKRLKREAKVQAKLESVLE